MCCSSLIVMVMSPDVAQASLSLSATTTCKVLQLEVEHGMPLRECGHRPGRLTVQAHCTVQAHSVLGDVFKTKFAMPLACSRDDFI